MRFRRVLGTILIHLGFDPRKLLRSILGLPLYLRQSITLLKWKIKHNNSEFSLRILPILSDFREFSGIAKGHYFHQDLWAAREVFQRKPDCHIDVGSRIDGFVAHILTFMDCFVVDVRELESKVDGLHFLQQDMMNAKISCEKYNSVSCLHALEHFGLGRYGDTLDLDGWKMGLKAISKLVASKGHLYLSVPIGQQAIEFNAQRIFAPQTIVSESLLNGLELVCFSYVDDDGDFHKNVDLNQASDCRYGCGCFEFVKV